MKAPKSCDTFVVLPPYTRHGAIIFGKNSDRPQNEVQEVVYIKSDGIPHTEKLKCTYITIEASEKPINSVILSKPAWMWGAEMGANDRNVVIGNEAVWTINSHGDGDASQKRLLGMDLVRLGLERGNSAEDALNVITNLLEKYGQGGPCSEFDDSHYYHNSFLIADRQEAWVLETSGKIWAAERVQYGYRNISNGLTITTKFDKHSDGLYERARIVGSWNGQGDLDFSKAFSAGGDSKRQLEGERLLKEYTASEDFNFTDMFKILRDKNSGICRSCDDTFPTQGSQVSFLSIFSPSFHWFTATPDPCISYFKPFVFSSGAKISEHTVSSENNGRQHKLYELHHKWHCDPSTPKVALPAIEQSCVAELNNFLEELQQGEASLDELDELMKDCVENEMKLYSES